MRVLTTVEKKKRGCPYCRDVIVERINGKPKTGCPFDECPYKVLDKYNSYEDFMQSEDSKILVDEFFTSVGGCDVLHSTDSKQKRLHSDGDAKVNL